MDPDVALFAHVVEAGSLSAAARARGISPAMVSKRIARLEARLGVQLLHRTTRRLETTARGELFYRDVTAILSAIGIAEARVSDRDLTPQGALRVSAPTSFGRLHIAPRLKPFLDRFPLIELELLLSDDFVDVARDGIDLAIRITPAVAPELEAQRLGDSRRVLCAAPAYLAEAGMPESVAALAGHRLLAASGQLPWRLAGPDGDVTIHGTSHVRTNSSEVARELVLSGVGIALRSLWDVGEHLARGDLRRVLPALEGSADVGIYAVHPRGRLSSGGRALLDYLGTLWTPLAPWD
ncbi:MAG TPA: LysR family transcriptional regulator [Sphingomonas sp.]|nr:LysR family transcriptional regulator [Sphingomonas sp.]